MSFQINCPHCNRVLNVTEKAYGRVLPCPGCQQSMTVPQPAATPSPPSPDRHWSPGVGAAEEGQAVRPATLRLPAGMPPMPDGNPPERPPGDPLGFLNQAAVPLRTIGARQASLGRPAPSRGDKAGRNRVARSLLDHRRGVGDYQRHVDDLCRRFHRQHGTGRREHVRSPATGILCFLRGTDRPRRPAMVPLWAAPGSGLLWPLEPSQVGTDIGEGLGRDTGYRQPHPLRGGAGHAGRNCPHPGRAGHLRRDRGVSLREF